MSEIDWTYWEEAKKKAVDYFLDDMKNLASSSSVFSKIVSNEWDGTIESVNSPESLTRNAMMSRAAYRDNDGNFDKGSWEQNLLTNSFYKDAFE